MASHISDSRRTLLKRFTSWMPVGEVTLIFVGIDVIGDYLTEINVTSPTGLQEIGRFDGTDLSAQIWDAIERRL